MVVVVFVRCCCAFHIIDDDGQRRKRKALGRDWPRARRGDAFEYMIVPADLRMCHVSVSVSAVASLTRLTSAKR